MPVSSAGPSGDGADAPTPAVTPTLRRRFAALVYESLTVLALVLPVVAVFSVFTALLPGLPMRRPLLLLCCFAALGAYFTYCWGKGQTLAMRSWKIRIQGPDGGPPSRRRAWARYVLAWVWVAPPLAWVAATSSAAQTPGRMLSAGGVALVAWALAWLLASLAHPKRQLWHDAAAGTRLVRA